MIRTVIIEDEIPSQQLLSTIVNEYCPYLQLVGIAESVESGVKLLNDVQPDLVFLDIHIGHQTGFDLLDKLELKDFRVIITTAHEEFALKALKYETIDYILKPYTPKDVIESVLRIKEKFDENKKYLNLDNVIKDSFLNKAQDKLSFPTSEDILVFKVENITRIEGFGGYCRIFSTDSKTQLISKSLNDVERLLPENTFFRIHDSHIINLKHIKEFSREDRDVVILENDYQVPISIETKQEFLDMLMEYGIK